MTILKFMSAIAIAGLTLCVNANQSTMGPAIKDYGPVYPVKEMDEPLPMDFHYKAVFDVYKTATDETTHSRRLESVARFINMHAAKGVPTEKMSLAVVFHGKATKDILNDIEYKKKYQVSNPNRPLIAALSKAGVKLYVCGQTTDYFKYKRSDILPEVKIALSAMTQLTYLQAQGYALLP